MENDSEYRALLIDGTKVLESRHIDLAANESHDVPVDPADDTQCDSCQ
jgi:hypothetical protein